MLSAARYTAVLRSAAIVCDGGRRMWYVDLSVMQVLMNCPNCWAQLPDDESRQIHQGHS
jgi:hypothetical protein